MFFDLPSIPGSYQLDPDNPGELILVCPACHGANRMARTQVYSGEEFQTVYTACAWCFTAFHVHAPVLWLVHPDPFTLLEQEPEFLDVLEAIERIAETHEE